MSARRAGARRYRVGDRVTLGERSPNLAARGRTGTVTRTYRLLVGPQWCLVHFAEDEETVIRAAEVRPALDEER